MINRNKNKPLIAIDNTDGFKYGKPIFNTGDIVIDFNEVLKLIIDVDIKQI